MFSLIRGVFKNPVSSKAESVQTMVEESNDSDYAVLHIVVRAGKETIRNLENVVLSDVYGALQNRSIPKIENLGSLSAGGIDTSKPTL